MKTQAWCFRPHTKPDISSLQDRNQDPGGEKLDTGRGVTTVRDLVTHLLRAVCHSPITPLQNLSALENQSHFLPSESKPSKSFLKFNTLSEV